MRPLLGRPASGCRLVCHKLVYSLLGTSLYFETGKRMGVWKSGNPESGIGTGIGTGTGTGTGIGTGMGRETYIKAGTTFTLI